MKKSLLVLVVLLVLLGSLLVVGCGNDDEKSNDCDGGSFSFTNPNTYKKFDIITRLTCIREEDKWGLFVLIKAKEKYEDMQIYVNDQKITYNANWIYDYHTPDEYDFEQDCDIDYGEISSDFKWSLYLLALEKSFSYHPIEGKNFKIKLQYADQTHESSLVYPFMPQLTVNYTPEQCTASWTMGENAQYQEITMDSYNYETQKLFRYSRLISGELRNFTVHKSDLNQDFANSIVFQVDNTAIKYKDENEVLFIFKTINEYTFIDGDK